MPKLPVLSGREVIKALGRIGYEVDYQTGSHVILRQTHTCTWMEEERRQGGD